ncbi:MAG: hypothetical protein AB1744_12660 [Candidatus Zixiibacteriota bacterium]
MSLGYATVTARRAWFVPGFVVWGLPVWAEVELLSIEQVGSDKTIGYNSLTMGETSQQVAFADLTDHRGNQLPTGIASPRVIVRSRGSDAAFVTGAETDSHFTIARDPASDRPVTVDLLIIELGD